VNLWIRRNTLGNLRYTICENSLQMIRMSPLPMPNKAAANPRQRAHGHVRAMFARAGARTEAARAYETGGLRLRFPRSGPECECVIVNTGGGMAGGDRATVEMSAGVGATALVTTQAAEKIYRSDGASILTAVTLDVAARGSLVWAPQETLLFEGAYLSRCLEAKVAIDASLCVVESAVFGRIAHGETRVDAMFQDSWRIWRGGRLVFADALRIDHAGAQLDRLAVGAGARAIATLVLVATDAATKLVAVRAALDETMALPGDRVEGGASSFDGLLVARLASPSPHRLRVAIVAAMGVLRGREAPRVWT
jgi:urease accessory protein